MIKRIPVSALFLATLFLSATAVKGQSAVFPGADPLICEVGNTMKPCQVLNLDPTLFTITGVGDLRVAIVEDTRCPRFARCREAGRIVLNFSFTEVDGSAAEPIQLEYKRNQDNPIEIPLTDGSVAKIDVLEVTQKIIGLPPEMFEVKIGYAVDSM
jgi:hypothetical protein